MDNKLLELVKDYFNKRGDVAFAFLFGSAARRKVRREGDVDVAVYFKPEKVRDWLMTSYKEKRLGTRQIDQNLFLM